MKILQQYISKVQKTLHNTDNINNFKRFYCNHKISPIKHFKIIYKKPNKIPQLTYK